MPQITNVTVSNPQQRLTVQTAATADVTEAPPDTGIIVNAPLVDENGGPRTGPFGAGNVYRISGTDANGVVQHYNGLRYTNQTPDGNAQYTTQ